MRISTGVMLPSNREVAIKDQSFSSAEEATSAVEEALTQTSLGADPHIARVYGVCMSQQDDSIVVSIVVELFDRSLMDEIEGRQSEGNQWSEDELWTYLRQIVSSLERAQVMGFCHRDIKPQNLYLTKDGDIKLGDFGSSKTLKSGVTSHSIQGSPYFLSPLLKQALMQSFSSPTPQRAKHNAFKSDVYSLGLTVLMMAQLKQNTLMTRLDQLSQGAMDAVADLPYSHQFKTVVLSMLQEDEQNRPDFVQLSQILQTGVPRPSETTTQASLYHTLEPSVHTLVESLNGAPIDSHQLLTLFTRNAAVRATVELPLRCSVCSQMYTLDATNGCPSDFQLIFCSQDCLARGGNQPLTETPTPASNPLIGELQESMKKSFHDLKTQNLCIACQRRSVEYRDVLLCKKCNEGQKREIERINYDECAQCLRRWQKQSKLSMLFQRKKVNAYKLPCKHTICSAKCFKDALTLRQECPSCHHPIPDRLLPPSKPTS